MEEPSQMVLGRAGLPSSGDSSGEDRVIEG
jgi:hypothetical protein